MCTWARSCLHRDDAARAGAHSGNRRDRIRFAPLIDAGLYPAFVRLSLCVVALSAHGRWATPGERLVFPRIGCLFRDRRRAPGTDCSVSRYRAALWQHVIHDPAAFRRARGRTIAVETSRRALTAPEGLRHRRDPAQSEGHGNTETHFRNAPRAIAKDDRNFNDAEISSTLHQRFERDLKTSRGWR